MTRLAHHTHICWVRYVRAKQISPALAYVEHENSPSGGGIFVSTRFLTRLVGHVINIHGSNMDANKSGDISKISNNNIINVTEEHLNDIQKQQLAQAVDGFKASCLQSFSFMG